MSAARAHERRMLEEAIRGESARSAAHALYTRLVRGNVSAVIRGVLPRTTTEAERIGRFTSDLDAFWRERGPRTPHLRDVPFEFVEHSSRRWREDGARCLLDLARFETTEFRLGYLERPVPADAGEMRLETTLVFRLPLELVDFEHAVQSESPQTLDPHALLFYRDDHERVRTLRLSPTARALLQYALAGHPLQEALTRAASDTNLPLDDSTLSSTARFLDDLATRGVLLGGRA